MKIFMSHFNKYIIRKLILLFFLFNLSFSFSQNYKVRIKASINLTGPALMIGYDSYNNEMPDNENCYNNYTNPCFNYDMTLCSSSISSTGNIETTRYFNVNSIPTEIRGKFYYVTSISNGVGCYNGSSAVDHNTAISNSQSCQIYTSQVSNTKIELTYAPITEDIQSDIVNNELTLTDVFNLSFKSGNAISPKYSIDTGQTWQSFSIQPGGITLEYLGLSSSDFINKNIFFKGYNCLSGESDFIIINFINSSPQLDTESISEIATSCSYKADGDFSFAVKRNLNTGERLVVSLFFEDPLNTLVGYSQFSQQDTFDLTDNSNGTYTFNWDNIKKPLDKGQYFVVYQSLDLPDPNAVPGSLKWSTTENFEVNIGNPPPLIFTATPTDVNCNGGNDGSIQLSAQGGVGNYEYFLGDATIGTPFSITGKGTNTNPIIHNITNLPAGTKTIKVQDGNGCVER